MNIIRLHNRFVVLKFILFAVVGSVAFAVAQGGERCSHCLIPGRCRWCDGDGIKQRCSSCNGTGRQRNPWPEIASAAGREQPHYTSCRPCNGTGNERCSYCSGGGRCSHCVAGYTTSGTPSTVRSTQIVVGWDRCFWCNGSGKKVLFVDLNGQNHVIPCPVCTGRGKTPRYGSAVTSASGATQSTGGQEITATMRIKNVEFDLRREDSLGTETLGICVTVDFEVSGAKDRSGVVALFFTKPDGSFLKDSDSKYQTVTGEVTVQNKIQPAYDHTLYRDEELFIPYSQLDLPRGRHDLHIQAEILMESPTGNAHIASAEPYSCWVRIE